MTCAAVRCPEMGAQSLRERAGKHEHVVGELLERDADRAARACRVAAG